MLMSLLLSWTFFVSRMVPMTCQDAAEECLGDCDSTMLLQLKYDLQSGHDEQALVRERPFLSPLQSGIYAAGPYPESSLKKQSMNEVNMACNGVSLFGASTLKLPHSIVTEVIAMKQRNSTKTFRSNFQGTTQRKFRDWVAPLIEQHFDERDLLIATDSSPNRTSMGSYDHTNDQDYLRPPDQHRQIENFDPRYYQIMIQSNFTLCPGGDEPWSIRFVEAILAGSIPVIHSEQTDYADSPFKSFWFKHVGYTYFTTDQMLNMNMSSAELKSIADHNYELFLEYQTFEHGDQVPPFYNATSDPCDADDYCRFCCETSDFKCWSMANPEILLKELGLEFPYEKLRDTYGWDKLKVPA